VNSGSSYSLYSSILLEMTILAQLVKKLSAFCGNSSPQQPPLGTYEPEESSLHLHTIDSFSKIGFNIVLLSAKCYLDPTICSSLVSHP
jgi:hypothetical protein